MAENETPTPVEEGTSAPVASTDPVAALAAEMEAMDKASTPTEPEAPDATPTPVDPNADTKEIPKEPPPPAEDPADVSPQIAAIARAKKRADAEIEKGRIELTRKEAELAQKLKAVEVFESARANIRRDPVGVIKALLGDDRQGITDIAQTLFYDALGEDAPKEYKEKRSELGLKKQIEELRHDMAEMRRQAEESARSADQERALGNYKGQIGTYLTEAPAELALVRKAVKHDPKGAAEILLSLAIRHCEANPGAAVPSPAQLATWWEEGLKAELAPFLDDGKAPPVAPKPNATTKPEEKTAPRTITNQLGSQTAPRKAPTTEWEKLQEVVKGLEELGL